MSTYKQPFKSMTQGYFDRKNGKLVSTIKLDALLEAWGIPYDDLSNTIEVGILHGKRRPEIVDDVLALSVTKAVEKYCEEHSKEDIIKMALVAIILILMAAFVSEAHAEKQS